MKINVVGKRGSVMCGVWYLVSGCLTRVEQRVGVVEVDEGLCSAAMPATPPLAQCIPIRAE